MICALSCNHNVMKRCAFDCNVAVSSAIKVLVDRKALQGALVNLLENAWHFSAAGDVLRLSVESQDAALLFRVEDAGPGLDPEQLDKMFEPFSPRGRAAPVWGWPLSRKWWMNWAAKSAVSIGEGGACFELSLPMMQS